MGLGTAVALAGLGMSAYQGIKGAQAEAAANDAAQNAANEAARIAEADKFKSLQVPTLGLELAQQNMQARQAQDLQALREGVGAAGVLGGLTALNQQGRAEDLALSAEAQNAQYQRDLAQAQNAQQIEQGRMQREFAMNQSKLAGAQAAASEGRQNQVAAVQGGIGALSNLVMLNTYKDIYGKDDTTNKSNFWGDLGYSLGLGGKNATPVSETMFDAKESFKPTIQAMTPNNIQPQVATNPGLSSMQSTMAQQKQLNALRDPQAQFSSQYRWNPYINQWVLK